jgi:hypothetical protein
MKKQQKQSTRKTFHNPFSPKLLEEADIYEIPVIDAEGYTLSYTSETVYDARHAIAVLISHRVDAVNMMLSLPIRSLKRICKGRVPNYGSMNKHQLVTAYLGFNVSST